MPSSTFEGLLEQVGGRGRFQLLLFVWTSSTGFIAAFQSLGSIFLAATPDHRCAVPGGDDQSKWGANWTEERVKDYSILRMDDGIFDQCHMWNRNYSDDYVFAYPWSESLENHTGLGQSSCQEYTYDHTEFDETFVTRWNLVCEKAVLASTNQAVFMVGVFMGTCCYGLVSDRYGRRLTILVSTFQFILGQFLAAIPFHYVWHLAFRLFTGVGSGGMFAASFVLMAEFISPSLRDVSGMAFQIPFGIAYMILPGIAYVIRTWYLLQLAFASVSLCGLLFYWLIPESPRWLIQQHRFPEALAILKRTAKVNERKVSEDTMLAAMKECYDMDMDDNKSAKQSATEIYFSLFKTPKMRKHIIVSYFIWASASFCYYGVSLNIPTLGDNIYLVTFLSSLTEVPSYICGAIIIRFFPRKTNVILTFLVAGVACLLTLVVPADTMWAVTVLSIAGKFFINITFAMVYVYTTEIFPTRNRNVALGTSSTCARLGSMTAPFLATSVGGNTPLIIFGIISIVAGLLCTLLPETRGKKLPETLSDVEFGNGNLTELRQSERIILP